MKAVVPKYVHEGWGRLTGYLQHDQHEPSSSSGSGSRQANPVPLLMQDPITLMLQNVLLLPFNVDSGKALLYCVYFISKHSFESIL